MVAALNEHLWTYDDASFLPHGAAGDGDPMTQPIFLTSELENPNAATMLVRLSGAETAATDDAFDLVAHPVRRARRGGACPGARRMAAAQGRGPHDQLLARERRGRLGAGAVSLGFLGRWPFRSEFPYFRLLEMLGFPSIFSSEIETYQWVTRDFRRKIFQRSLSVGVAARSHVGRALGRERARLSIA